MANPLVATDEPVRKILFLGDEKVGKTTFIKRYCEHMREYYKCEVYEGHFLVFRQFLWYRDYRGRPLPTRFLDLPAGSTIQSRADQYPNRVNLIVLCYAVDNPASLVSICERWIPEFLPYYLESPRLCLLGLKNDMRLAMIAAKKSPITEERAREVHQEYGFEGENMECSVEANPKKARGCMTKILDEALMYDPPIIHDAPDSDDPIDHD